MSDLTGIRFFYSPRVALNSYNLPFANALSQPPIKAICRFSFCLVLLLLRFYHPHLHRAHPLLHHLFGHAFFSLIFSNFIEKLINRKIRTFHQRGPAVIANWSRMTKCVRTSKKDGESWADRDFQQLTKNEDENEAKDKAGEGRGGGRRRRRPSSNYERREVRTVGVGEE